MTTHNDDVALQILGPMMDQVDRCTLTEFLADNADQEWPEVEALKVGESYSGGGGAAPEFTIERIPAWLHVMPPIPLADNVPTKSTLAPLDGQIVIFKALTTNGKIGIFNPSSLRWLYCTPEELDHLRMDLGDDRGYGRAVQLLTSDGAFNGSAHEKTVMACLMAWAAGNVRDEDRLALAKVWREVKS